MRGTNVRSRIASYNVAIQISVSSSLLGNYDEPEILRYAILPFCPIGADVTRQLVKP